jgi:hypothetical protein
LKRVKTLYRKIGGARNLDTTEWALFTGNNSVERLKFKIVVAARSGRLCLGFQLEIFCKVRVKKLGAATLAVTALR